MTVNKVLIGTWAWGSGMNGSSMVFGNRPDKERLSQTFETAYGLGFKNWDTAAVYGMGTCESFLGSLIKGKEDIFISTKFFPDKKYKQGALTGHYSAGNHFPVFSMRNLVFPKSKFRKIEGLLDMMRGIAGGYGIDPSQVPILWAIGKGAVPIVGMTKTRHAETLADSLKVRLTPEEIVRLEETARATGIRQQGSWEPQ